MRCTNRFHNMASLPLGRTDCCRISFRNRRMWNILDENVCQFRSNNPKQHNTQWGPSSLTKRSYMFNINSFYSFYFLITLPALRSQILLKTIFAIQSSRFLDETNVQQRTSTFVIDTNEVFRTPNFSKSCNEWPSVTPILGIIFPT